MSSFKSNVLKLVLRNTINRDPARMLSESEKKRAKSENKYLESFSKEFAISKEETPKGTGYLRVHKKDSEKNGKVLYYLHGGAFLSGLFSYYLNHAKYFIMASAGGEVIYLDYPLAPEHKYPTQLNEALDLWSDLTGRQGYKPESIIVGGDSAGGNLTLSMMLNLRDKGMAMPKAAFCISPWADMTGSGKSFKENFSKDVMFGRKGIEFNEETKKLILNSDVYSFVGNADRSDPYVSPVYGDYHGFPPMFFTAGGDEMLLSDTYTIAENLKKNNVFVDYDVQPEMFHIYTLLGNNTPESAISYKKLLKFIREQYEK